MHSLRRGVALRRRVSLFGYGERDFRFEAGIHRIFGTEQDKTK